jgi:4-amino-4-deoxy-L-arabinose transferase-like glycosyltransferase
VVFARLGHGYLANFDDCYYAEKAKEMLRDGQWLTPHFAGIARWDNPPLFLWLIALSFRVLGITCYSAIFFSAVSGVLCVLVLYGLAGRLGLDPFERWTAAFVLLTTQYFLKYSRHAMVDVFLTLLFLLAIDAYVRAARGKQAWLLLFGLLCGLGVMTKSVLGLLPLAVAALHLLATGNARRLATGWFLGAVAIALLTAVPWYVYAYHVGGAAFVREHFQWLLWERGFVIGREGQTWSDHLGYLKELAVNYWPWLPLAAAGLVAEAGPWLRRGRGVADAGTSGAPEQPSGALAPRERSLLLFLWLAVVIGIMSLAIEKKLWYIMSAFPGLAILCARATGTWIPGERGRARTVAVGFAFLLALAAILNLTPLGLHFERNPDLMRIAQVVREVVPPGEKVLNLDARYWKYGNQFLFYSDRDLTQPLGEPGRIRAGLDRGEYALLSDTGYQTVAGDDTAAYPVVARSGRWLLAKGAPPAAAILPPLDPYP